MTARPALAWVAVVGLAPTVSEACGRCVPLVRGLVFSEGFWANLGLLWVPLAALVPLALLIPELLD